ncbi:MAG: TetR/AcrR family transcriptional regulator [Promethearchaeota archaeon]
MTEKQDQKKDKKSSDNSKQTRRRGEKLEDAILQATWDELERIGYKNLTMDNVASKAHTSKSVIYRRWTGRADLVLASLRNRMGSVENHIPDTGNLREDVLQLLNQEKGKFLQIPKKIREEIITEFLPLEKSGVFRVLPDLMNVILERAKNRGEIPKKPIPFRIIRLPFDLVRHELIFNQKLIKDSDLEEIIDIIFLPLVLK